MSNSGCHAMSDSDEDETPVVQSTTPGLNPKSMDELSESDEDAKPTTSAASSSQKRKASHSQSSQGSTPIAKRLKSDHRPMCKYGANCYRKNPSHFKDFQHPAELETQTLQKARSRATTELSDVTSAAAASCKDKVIPVDEKLAQAQPFGMLLTKVTGIDKKFNRRAVNINDILSHSLGKLEKSVQFNYCIDIPWLVSQYPPEFRDTPVLVVHGMQREEKKGLENDAKPYSNITLCAAPMDIPYGTHHTVWISPMCKPLATGQAESEGESSTNFRQDLIKYLTAYQSRALLEWCNTLKQHDMSAVNVHLIGSVPGRHTGHNKASWGHMRLRNVLVREGPDAKSTHKWPVVGQFSSVGSLGNNKQSWLCGEWLSSITACKGLVGGIQSQANPLHLVFPSKDNIRLSLEGYAAGGSVPYSINTAKKQPWFHDFLHQWKADIQGRSMASPHIKTFCRPSPDFTKLAWFLLTSANMSKAAWGTLEKGGSQLMVRSYELGVLFLPSHPSFKEKYFGIEGKESEEKLKFPVPIDLPPVAYVKGQDRPWIWDIPYVDKPDTHGTKWCPPL